MKKSVHPGSGARTNGLASCGNLVKIPSLNSSRMSVFYEYISKS